MHSTAFGERAGAGKKNLDNDPSIRDNVQKVLDSTIAGNPQQPDVAWTHLSAGEVGRRLAHQAIQVSEYTVNKVYDALHLGVRQMSKSETMKEVGQHFLLVERGTSMGLSRSQSDAPAL